MHDYLRNIPISKFGLVVLALSSFASAATAATITYNMTFTPFSVADGGYLAQQAESAVSRSMPRA
jgi:hypothetical protein